MDFREIDFHIHPGHAIENSVNRAFRLRINHIIDSIYMRIPRGLDTQFFCKLNVSINSFKTKNKFWHFERIASVDYFDPNAEDLLSLPQQESIDLVQSYLLRGISVAAKHDPKFAKHVSTIRPLIKTAHLPYDYRTGVSCSSRGDGLKSELVLRIQANEYLWDVEVRGTETTERLNLMKTDAAFPYFTGFKKYKLSWSGNRILLTDLTGKVLAEHVSKLKSQSESIKPSR